METRLVSRAYQSGRLLEVGVGLLARREFAEDDVAVAMLTPPLELLALEVVGPTARVAPGRLPNPEQGVEVLAAEGPYLNFS